MRNTIWRFVRSRLPEGMILPWWALTIRAVLFPLEFFYWRMSKRTGYRWEDDTWLINGVRYSGEAMRWLAQAKGETYRIERTGDTVTMTRVLNGGNEGTPLCGGPARMKCSAPEADMLDKIDAKKKYTDSTGVAVIVGFVKHYVVWRRPGCAAHVCTLNDFAKRFREVPNACGEPGLTEPGKD